MIVDAAEMLKSTVRATQVLPTHTPTHVAPIPSVLPDVHYQYVGDKGERTLWVVFVLMVIASAVFAGWSLRFAVSTRVYHVLATLTTLISALAYFFMATGQGSAVKHITIRHSNDHVPDTFEHIHRQIFWPRYVQWILTFPLIILNLGILAGISGAHILIAATAGALMNFMGLWASFGKEDTPQKWGNYTIAVLAFLVVVWHLGLNGRAAVRNSSQSVGKFYTALAAYTGVVWAAYAIVWGVALGGHFTVDGEIITFAVLDVLSIGVFGLWLLLTIARNAETNVNLQGFWSTGVNREGALRLDDDDGA